MTPTIDRIKVGTVTALTSAATMFGGAGTVSTSTITTALATTAAGYTVMMPSAVEARGQNGLGQESPGSGGNNNSGGGNNNSGGGNNNSGGGNNNSGGGNNNSGGGNNNSGGGNNNSGGGNNNSGGNGASPTGDCCTGGDEPDTPDTPDTPDRSRDNDDPAMYGCFFDTSNRRNLRTTQGNVYSYVDVTIYPIRPSGLVMDSPTVTGTIRDRNGDDFRRMNQGRTAQSALRRCDNAFETLRYQQQPTPTRQTISTPNRTTTTQRTSTPAAPVYTYDPNTYITTNRGATGECEAAFGILSDIKRSTPSNVRVDPVLRVGEDYSQFSAIQVELQNSCEQYGVVDRRGRVCTFDFDDARGGELFAEGGACPARNEEQPAPAPVQTPEPQEQQSNGQCVAVVAHEEGLRRNGDTVIASWENPNDNSVYTVEHEGLNDVIGFDCDNDPELEYFATTSVDISEVSTLLERNENGQYVGITSATADFELVREERAPAICPQTVEQICTGAGFTAPAPTRN